MTILLGIAQFMIIAYICVFEFKRKSSSIFLWATLMIMFGVMHLITSFIGDDVYSNSVLIEASIFVILFCFVYIICRMVFSRNIKERNVFTYNNMRNSLLNNHNKLNFFFYAYILVFVFKIFPYIRFAGNILSTSWSTGRDFSASMGYANSSQLINIAFYSLAGMTAVLWMKGQKKKYIVSLLLVLFNVILTRNRIETLRFFCSIICLFLWKIKSLKFKHIILAGVGAIAVVYIVYGLRVFRHYGTISDFILNYNTKEFFDKINLYIKTGNGELGLLRDMYYFIDHNNNFPEFSRLYSYIRMVLVYIPTQFSLGLKPDDFAIAMGQAMGMATGGSTHPTLFGDCYANAGFFGILLGAFWAFYVSVIDKITFKRKSTEIKILVYILNAVVYTIIGRGSIYNGFWFVAYGMPLLCFVEYCLYHFKFKINNKLLPLRIRVK